MHRAILLVAAAGAMAIAGCAEPDESTAAGDKAPADVPDMHTSRISLDWSGTYSGVLPCADCEGIHTTVTLDDEERYRRSQTYLGKDAAPFIDEGEFDWNADGGSITIGDGETSRQYKIGENLLFHLDSDGNRISGEMAAQYVLTKHVSDPRIEGYRWVLTELRGQPVALPDSQQQPFLSFDAEAGRVSGNASCNNFFGEYAIKPGNRISFPGNMGMTMMACPDMALEQQFVDVLRMVDNYAVADDTLSLNRARMAPLARFTLDQGD